MLMRNQCIPLVMSILIVVSTLFFIPSVTSTEESLSPWNENWRFNQEIELPIATNVSYAHYQPIDIPVTFSNPCWTKNQNETSVRVCCWDGTLWHELESQIYDFTDCFTDSTRSYIQECSIVFLIPEFTTGNERYFVYYNDEATPGINYRNHVDVVDTFYSYSPLSEISAEAKYYKIEEEGYCIYGVGQEGTLLDRAFSQVVVKQKKGVKEFDVFDSDQVASFAFSYYYGSDEADESSSDQVFLNKQIFVDGNLMVNFGIRSESRTGDVRTTAIYKYYYTPLDDKRISVHLKHEFQEDAIVKGMENIDGRFGALVSMKSRNPVVEKLNFGEIYPYLHFYSAQGFIEEFQLNQNPESKNREWIISYKDDADLGEQAWLAYGNGKAGKTHGIIFSSNTGLVTSGIDEKDGIQLKVAVKEYFDFLGTEVDYASINFGRNSYNRGSTHDLSIPKNLVVECDLEVFTSVQGGYFAIQNESTVFQKLVEYRKMSEDSGFDEPVKKYDVTIVTHLGGTRFSYPRLVNRTGWRLPVIWVELYKDNQLIRQGATKRLLLIRSYEHFKQVPAGDYLVKIYRKIGNSSKVFVGAKTITVDENLKNPIHIFCTWERIVTISCSTQDNQPIPHVVVKLMNNDGYVYNENSTDDDGYAVMAVPFNRRDSYDIKVMYKGLDVFTATLNQSIRKTYVPIVIELYDVTLRVQDVFNLPPGVDVEPIILLTDETPVEGILIEENNPGVFLLKQLPIGEYLLQIRYGTSRDTIQIFVPETTDVTLDFSAVFLINLEVYDSTGSSFSDSSLSFIFLRDEKQVLQGGGTSFSLPPGQYTVRVLHSGTTLAEKSLFITNDVTVRIITSSSSLVSTILFYVLMILIGGVVVLKIMKRISLSTLFKFIAIPLILLAFLQPWWYFSGVSSDSAIARDTKMFLNPPVLIESTTINAQVSLEIAELPDIFLDVLTYLIVIGVSISLLICLSFIFSRYQKRWYSPVLLTVSMILLIAVVVIFHTATVKLCEASIGPVQGSDILSVSVHGEPVLMNAQWGFSIGFYCMIFAFIFILFSFLLEIKVTSSKMRSLWSNLRN